MAAIKKEIFSKVFTTSPKTVSAAIASLCREVSPEHRPVLVPVRPEPGATIGECFNNVNVKVGRDGGAIAYGCGDKYGDSKLAGLNFVDALTKRSRDFTPLRKRAIAYGRWLFSKVVLTTWYMFPVEPGWEAAAVAKPAQT